MGFKPIVQARCAGGGCGLCVGQVGKSMFLSSALRLKPNQRQWPSVGVKLMGRIHTGDVSDGNTVGVTMRNRMLFRQFLVSVFVLGAINTNGKFKHDVAEGGTGDWSGLRS